MSAEFILLNIGPDAAKVGSSYAVLGVAPTEAEARTLLASLPASTASHVAILEKKSVYRRVPSVKLEEATEDIFR
jgi:hypothetical protein